MLNDEWLTGPECVLHDKLENERRARDLSSHLQPQREQTTISNQPTISYPVSSVGGGTTNILSQSEPSGQPYGLLFPPTITGKPSNQHPEPSNQPSEPDPATDDTPPYMVDDSDESNSDDKDEVIDNSRLHHLTTIRSGSRVRPPNRINLNAMKVNE
jgi:hypothetical protein